MTTAGLRDFRRPRFWLGTWITMLAATVLVCLLPMPHSVPTVDHFDKFEHLAGYAILAAYAAMLFATPRARLRAGGMLILLGLALEGMQGWVPWRSADPLDAMANTVGVALGLLLAMTPASSALQRLDRCWP